MFRSGTFLLNAIDCTQDVWLGDLRRWTTNHVPTAGVGNKQAAIGIFDHIGRMEIGLIAFEKGACFRGIGRSGFGQAVAREAACVEFGKNQISFQAPTPDAVASPCPKGRRGPAATESAASLRCPDAERAREDFSCHTFLHKWRAESHRVFRAGKIKKRAAEKPFTRFTECQANWIVHPTRDDHFQLAAVRPSTIDMGGLGAERSAIAQFVFLRSKRSFAPVEETIRSEIRTVHVIATPFDRTAIEPNGSLIRHMVTVCITQFPYVWWCSDVDRIVVNKNAFRKRQFVGKDGRFIKDSIPVAVDQPQHSMLRIIELNRCLVRVARTVGDVENPIIVKAHMNGPLHQRRRGDTLQLISLRNGEGVRGERNGFCTVEQVEQTTRNAKATIPGMRIFALLGWNVNRYFSTILSTKNSTSDSYLVFAPGYFR